MARHRLPRADFAPTPLRPPLDRAADQARALGLPSTRRTVQAHGGVLEIETTVPGTRVRVRLPLPQSG